MAEKKERHSRSQFCAGAVNVRPAASLDEVGFFSPEEKVTGPS
jgi:hypothetical protein